MTEEERYAKSIRRMWVYFAIGLVCILIGYFMYSTGA